jgi:ribosomal protein S18 acetylase RimI-like enzyme
MVIYLKPMSVEAFAKFKLESQSTYANYIATQEKISTAEALNYASEQFDKLVPDGITTANQKFFEVIETNADEPIGFLWLGFQNKFGRNVVSINDINIRSADRGKGFGKALIKLVEEESLKIGATRIRLHVFHCNEVALQLYLSLGFVPTSLDMSKEITL